MELKLFFTKKLFGKIFFVQIVFFLHLILILKNEHFTMLTVPTNSSFEKKLSNRGAILGLFKLTRVNKDVHIE